MSGDSKAIVKTFRQILDIYKHIYMLMETSKELMEIEGWESSDGLQGPKANYFDGSDLALSDYPAIIKIPFYLQRSFASNGANSKNKYVTVMLEDEKPSKSIAFEPVVVGTTLKFVNRKEGTDWDGYDWDGYWWYHWKWNKAKGSNSERQCSWTLEKREVSEIQRQDWIKKENAVRSNLQSVHTFGIPLVKVTDTKTLKEKIIEPLLAV